jgi:signal transduction histidine kinase
VVTNDRIDGEDHSTGRRLTVQGWQNLVLVVMGGVVLAGAVAGAMLVQRTDDVMQELIDEIGPARIASYRLQAALRDQETSTRGYAISADKQFLEPYYSGQDDERDAANAIRASLNGRPQLIADLDNLEEAAASWRAAYAEPLIKSVTPRAPQTVSPDLVEAGKIEFDQIRSLFQTQTDNLQAVRDQYADQLNEVRSWRDRVLVVMIVAFFATAILLAIVSQRAITRPLAILAEQCRRITEGHFGERIVPRGPKDIRAIATDVENMRQRIVAELDTTREATAQLDEQTVELRRSNAELEQFAYVASHDLQEPLRKVASFCQLLEKRYGDQLDGRGIEYIGYAVDGAKRMQVLINDLLTFSRVGRLNTTDADVAIDDAIDTAVANLNTAIEESGAELVRPQALPVVQGDPTLLAMLWQNLIGNAVKFRRPDEPPRIVVDCTPGGDEYEGQWLFTVSDNGIGISAEFVEKVFVIFQRLHAREVYGGTGIGLALCKKIVEHHGGTIWIDTSYTAGTQFEFTLPVKPLATADDNAAGDVSSAAALEGPPQ